MLRKFHVISADKKLLRRTTGIGCLGFEAFRACTYTAVLSWSCAPDQRVASYQLAISGPPCLAQLPLASLSTYISQLGLL